MGGQTQKKIHPPKDVFSFNEQTALLVAFVRDGAYRFAIESRGQAHLVDYERSEIIYLVTGDDKKSIGILFIDIQSTKVKQKIKTALCHFFFAPKISK